MKKGDYTVPWDVRSLLKAKNNGGVARGFGGGVENLGSPAGKLPQVWRVVIRYSTYQPVSCDPDNRKLRSFVNVSFTSHVTYLQSFNVLRVKTGELW